MVSQQSQGLVVQSKIRSSDPGYSLWQLSSSALSPNSTIPIFAIGSRFRKFGRLSASDPENSVMSGLPTTRTLLNANAFPDTNVGSRAFQRGAATPALCASDALRAPVDEPPTVILRRKLASVGVALVRRMQRSFDRNRFSLRPWWFLR